MKNSIIHISIISIITIILFYIFFGNIYSPLSDISRELYITEELLNGQVLYKDVLNVYPPLGYMLNFFIVKIFGSSLNVFYFIGLILSLLTVNACYLISGFYLSKINSFFTALVIIPVCIYFPSISNYITPYSYSILYALCALLYAFYFLIKYLNTENKRYLAVSCILYGFSLSCKLEFAGFILVLLLSLLHNKKNIKYLFYVLVFPCLSYILLLFQHCNISDLVFSGKLIYKLLNSSSVLFFYSFCNFVPNGESLVNSSYSLINFSFDTIFFSLGYICLFLFIISLRNIKNDVKYFILNLTAVVISLKVIGCIRLEIYGTFFFPLLFISFIAFINKYIPKVKGIFIPIFCIIIFSAFLSYDISQNHLIPVKTDKGILKIRPIFYPTFIKTIDYINTKINKTDKILILPEGALLNYLTERKSDDYLYYLIPPNIEILGNDYIISRINSNLPEYIFVSNILYPWFNETTFYKGSGKEIYNFIQNKYKEIDIIGDDIQFFVFKRNE